MASVEWSLLSGDEIEAALALMLCREFPDATRVKPSLGGGGIDVWTPGAGGMSVYQVKCFTGNIDSERKKHIKDSWDTLLRYTAEKSLQISGWFLVTPQSPTKGQVQWLRELTKHASFPCSWLGHDFVGGLSSRNPDVIDYYFNDSKQTEATQGRHRHPRA